MIFSNAAKVKLLDQQPHEELHGECAQHRSKLKSFRSDKAGLNVVRTSTACE